MLELLWLLLPVAAFSGWVIGRRERTSPPRDDDREFSSDYFQGINYLLNEEPDKAIEVFTRMVEVDSDTVETHLALGNLFRRRGEVDRAIRIHQNLIARPSLSPSQRGYALLELGEDYMRAGLFDRAESLFNEAVDLDMHAGAALENLLDIYQQEKEWEQAVKAGQQLEQRTGRAMGATIAQFICEQAEDALSREAVAEARQHIRRALQVDPNCVRASMLLGDLERREGNYRAALKAYQRVKHQDIAYMPEVLERLVHCYRGLGQTGEAVRYLRRVQREYRAVSITIVLTDLIQEQDGDKAAMDFISAQLRERPSIRGLKRLIELNVSDSDPDQRRQRDLQVLRELFDALLRERPGYLCRSCGFSGKALHWQCPSCKAWATIKPVKGLEGE
ncbi:lipopolysaccharide assembly protein LapB [Ectothiorhodospiraceae bacterium WFHF3C12]|nr:lipopolysaccharide assembly protein LapB [Ectothiorhodospiraceae bacterium WFHF3C12]